MKRFDTIIGISSEGECKGEYIKGFLYLRDGYELNEESSYCILVDYKSFVYSLLLTEKIRGTRLVLTEKNKEWK